MPLRVLAGDLRGEDSYSTLGTITIENAFEDPLGNHPSLPASGPCIARYCPLASLWHPFRT